MKYDFNALEMAAQGFWEHGEYKKALEVYYFMADGDPSLDAGYLGKRIAECYEALGEKYAARYWYGRALEENPVVYASCRAAIYALGGSPLDDGLAQKV